MAHARRTARELAAGGLGLALVAGGIALATTGDAAPAGAAQRCTAWAALPATVTLTSHLTLRPQLVGTPGCRAGSFDNGATAALFGPGRNGETQRWSRFGDREEIDLYRDLDRPGTYSIRSGNVQAYDQDEVRIPTTWRTTSVVVKYGSGFGRVRDTDRSTRATLTRWTSDGTRRSAGTPVALQRRGAHGWSTVARATTSRSGAVTFRHRPGTYRLVSASTATTWGAVRSLGR